MIADRVQGEFIRAAKRVLRPWRRRTRPYALLLLYHRIARDANDPWRLCVTPENFRAHLEVLRRHCELVPLGEVPARLGAPRPARRPPVAITFDDGYVDNLRNALPVLREFAAPATVFLATHWIGQDRGFWWDRLAKAVLASPRLPAAIDVGARTSAFRWRRAPAGVPERRQRARLHRDLWRHLQALPGGEREELLTRLEGIFCVASEADPDARPMRPDEVRELHASGLVNIGAHARTHRPLPSLDEAEQAAEICGSREDVRVLTGVVPDAFAYPHGEVAPASPRLVERAGFALACSTVEELAWPGRDPFLLPRVTAYDWDAPRFERWLRAVWLG